MRPNVPTRSSHRSAPTLARACLLIALLAALGCGGEDDPPVSGPALEWREVEAARPGGAFLSAWASGPSDVWIVGGDPGRSLVFHYDGTSWSERDPGLGEQLWWVHGFPGGAVYVVGDRGVAARWHEGAWSPIDTGAPGTTFFGIWGASEAELWAVGGPSLRAPEGDREGDVVVRIAPDGVSRVEIAALADAPASQGKNLYKVWGSAAADVFIVGDSGKVFHWAGQSWAPMANPATGQSLFTVVGRGPDDVWAVGGLAESVLIHYDGSAWERVELPLLAPQVVQGIFTAPGLPVYLGGYFGFTASQDARSEWDVVDTGSNLAYHAVFSDGEGLWAVGGDIYAQQATYVGTILTTRSGVPPLPPP